MGRWTQYDEDEYRLPEGMQRVGYDADSGKYYFRDRECALWEGTEGVKYGKMRMVSHAPIATGGQDELGDVEAVAKRRPNSGQPRQLLTTTRDLGTNEQRRRISLNRAPPTIPPAEAAPSRVDDYQPLATDLVRPQRCLLLKLVMCKARLKALSRRLRRAGPLVRDFVKFHPKRSQQPLQ
ncbi:hypothetical protein WOLCODRAFT_110125 [Wolfiporia cocos MD-104 SS10]|uniref:Uncharacterized protein n=1 Tax=Wolfiporia cocos (strain MD-104) TaxID=742152 RepID=A0A2H3JIL0_WOLCO|nr:hypothetical protein WOLCODRAFT_110125 [Wolfiporia cocos MD-104 SS10]